MTPEPKQQISDLIDQLFVLQIGQGAKLDALFVLVEKMAAHNGVTGVDGKPLREWFEEERKAQLLNALIKMDEAINDRAFVARLTSKFPSLR